ncbi:Adenylate kinase [Burkholderia cepacia]|nr:Adenylate kinase [Burkholderia cepacia]
MRRSPVTWVMGGPGCSHGLPDLWRKATSTSWGRCESIARTSQAGTGGALAVILWYGYFRLMLIFCVSTSARTTH